MGYDAITILQRRVTRADTPSIKTRLCVLMCGRREECALSWECVVHIAKAIKATPFGGKEFVSCQFEEHLFAKQRTWDDLYAHYLQAKFDLKARWQATPDMKLPCPWIGVDQLTFAAATTEIQFQSWPRQESTGPISNQILPMSDIGRI